MNTQPLRLWDESRLAISAYEMQKDGHWLIITFGGVPDLWNTKPPLMIWSQAVLMKTIGVNELSVRLPSAIAAFLTCIILLLFSIKYLKKEWLGIIIILVLITSPGYIKMHGTRSGDYDALLTFYTTLFSLCFFLFIETKKNKYLYLTFIFITLSVLTKSITGLIFLPALLAYAIIQKQFLATLKNKHFYIGMGIFLIFAGGYYLLREYLSSGYLKAVLNNELGGRYLEVTESHSEADWYYLNNLVKFQPFAWYISVFPGAVIGLLSKNRKIFRITLYLILLVLTFFTVITLGKTKLVWYDLPLYPFYAFLSAIFIYFIFDLLKKSEFLHNGLNYNVLPHIFLFLIVIMPFRNIIDATYKPEKKEISKDYFHLAYFLKEAAEGKRNLDNYYLANKDYKPHYLFYMHILQDQGKKITYKDYTELDSTDRIIAHQGEVNLFISENYKYQILDSNRNITIYEIYGK